MPSHTSMWRHWIRSCWVAHMWSNSSRENIRESLPSPETCGWKKNSDGSYAFDWECPDVQKKVRDTIDFLTKGCSCKKGCLSKRCGCKKNNHHCGPGCQCHNCENIPPTTSSIATSMVDEGHTMVDEGHATTEDDDDSDVAGEEPDLGESDTEDSSSEADSDERTETEIITDLYDEQNDFSISSF